MDFFIVARAPKAAPFPSSCASAPSGCPNRSVVSTSSRPRRRTGEVFADGCVSRVCARRNGKAASPGASHKALAYI